MADAADIVIRVRADGVGTADAALRRLEATGVRVETVSSRMENGFRKTAQSAEAFQQSVATVHTIMTAATILTYAGALTKLSDAWIDVTNKLANANSAHENMAVVQQRVFDVAQRTRTSLESTATLYSRMERSLSQYGVTGQQVARITETINKSMIVSGATTAEATAAIIQFSQGLQSGVLRGDEFRSVMEQAPRLGKMIADGLGVGTAGLREMANTGKLTTDVLINAISKAAGTIEAEFGRTMPTFSQRWAMATNEVQKFAGTSREIQTVVNAMGSGIKVLTDNLQGLTIAITGVVAILTGRMLTSLYSQVAAYVQLNASIASSSAIHIKSIDAITRSSVARYNDAAATLAQAQAERVKIQAALAADQAQYKGIATLNAYMQNTKQVRVATEALSVAQTAMAARMSIATTASRVLTVGLTGLRTVMGVLGGPLGIIMLAATGWYMYSQNAKQAVEASRNLALSQEDLTAKLKDSTLEQQRALMVQLQRAQVTLQEKIDDESNALKQMQGNLKAATNAQNLATEGTFEYNAAVDAQKRLQDDIAVKLGEISGLEKSSADIKNNLITVERNLANAVMGSGDAYQYLTQAMNVNISSAAGRSKEVTGAIAAQNSELEIATMKLAGNTRGAAQLADAQNRLGKKYVENEKFIKDYVSGHADATAVLTDEQRGLVEFMDLSGRAYDAQSKLQQQTKAQRQSLRDDKAMTTYVENWDKAYERVEARGVTGLQRLQIQQDAEVRTINNKAERAKATEEELQAALSAIDAKYARLRADAAGEYKPGAQMVRDYRESQQEIKELQAAGLLNEEQANVARLELASEYYKKRAEMQSLNPMGASQDAMRSELDALQAQYQTQLEMATGQEDQLTAIKENYEKQRYDIQLQYAQKQAMAQNQTTMMYISSVSTMAGSMASILANAGAESSGAYKALFAMSKAFGIAQATMNLTLAISQAMADPTALSPLQKFANMAAIASAGASLVSQISSAAMTGMAHDGISNVPREGTWLLDKGERVLSPQQNADFTRFINGGGNGGGGVGGGVTIIQQITIQGAGDVALTEALQQAARDGAEQGYNKVLTDFATRGDIRRVAMG